MMKSSHKFLQNKDCKYFPCHNVKDLNCIFCFCPLYYICNREDCTKCLYPHKIKNYEKIVNTLKKEYKENVMKKCNRCNKKSKDVKLKQLGNNYYDTICSKCFKKMKKK